MLHSPDARGPLSPGLPQWGRQQATLEVASCEKEYNSKKANSRDFEQIYFNIRLFSSNGLGSCIGKPARDGTLSGLVAPLLHFESAQRVKWLH